MSDSTLPQPDISDIPDEDLSDFERSFLNVIESRFPVSEGTAEPGSTDESIPDGSSGASGDVEPGGGPDSGSPETEPGESTPDGGEAPAPEDGQSESAFTLSGVDYTPEQVAEAIQVHDWFARLDANTVQGIDALVSGQYRLTPAQEAAAQQQQYQQQPTVQPPGPAPSPPAPAAEDEGDWLDPRAAQEIADLKAQVAQLGQVVQTNLTPVIERQVQDDYQSRLDAISMASDDFRTRYELEDEQMRTLEAAVVESQVLPSLANRYGSVNAGMQAALEMYFWTTPAYRDTFLQRQAVAQAADHAANDAATVRKQQLTALSASGGSAPRREPVPSTKEDRHAAMTAEIASAWNGNGTV